MNMIHRLTAGCKVNLGLRVTGVRADGYHELDSLFYPLPEPCDHLEIRFSDREGIVVRCESEGIDPARNTLTKAYAAFARILEEGPKQPGPPAATRLAGLEVTLRKGIPLGAGLGGGSSDAAALLLWLNSRLEQPLPADELTRLALSVGADTPFFLQKAPCRVRGIGEKLSPVTRNFSGLHLVLVCPAIHVSTPWAFARYDELCGGPYAESLPDRSLEDRQNDLTKEASKANGSFLSEAQFPWDCRNDLEAAVFPRYPQLAAIKAELLRLGARAACMSGSGSSMLGLFGPDTAGMAGEQAARAAAVALRDGERRVFALAL